MEREERSVEEGSRRRLVEEVLLERLEGGLGDEDGTHSSFRQSEFLP